MAVNLPFAVCRLPFAVCRLPFAVWLLYSFILQVPQELEEAAAIDGCGPIQVHYKVMLPLIKPGIAVASLFTFRFPLNAFILAQVETDRATRALPMPALLYITGLTAGADKS